MGMNSLLSYARQNQQARMDADQRKRESLLRALDTLAGVGNTAIQGVGDYVQRHEQRQYQHGRDTVEDTFRRNEQQLQQDQFAYDKQSRDAAQALDVARFDQQKLTAEDERKLRERGVDVDKAKQAAYAYVYGQGTGFEDAAAGMSRQFTGRQGFLDVAKTPAGTLSLQDPELAGIYDQLAADKKERDRIASLQNSELALKRASMRRVGGGGAATKQPSAMFPKTLLEMSQQATSRYNAQLGAVSAANRVLNAANSGYAIDPISGAQTKFASEEDRQRVISESQANVLRLQQQAEDTKTELADLGEASAMVTAGVPEYTALQMTRQKREQKKAQESAFDAQFFDPMTGENLFNFPEQEAQPQAQPQQNTALRQQTPPSNNPPAAPIRSLDTAWMTPPTSFTQGGQDLTRYTAQQGSTFGAEGLPIAGSSPIDDLLLQDEQTDQTMRLEQLIEALASNPSAYGLPSGATVEQVLGVIKSTPDFENYVLVGDNPPVVK